MNIAVGCDHAGYVLKPVVMDCLARNPEVRLLDFGTHSEERVDYPDIALEAARAVSEGKADCGVLLCGTGIGMAIAANKIKGIRAAACNDVESARMARAHNNLNVLTLGGRVLAPGQVPGILDAWLTTPFEGGRHLVRINKIAAAEAADLCAGLPSGGRVVVFNHPLVQHKVGIIRSRDTSVKEFRELLQEIAGLMVYEITRNLPLTDVEVETPLAVTRARTLEGKKLAIVPVLRAGLGMVDGILQLVPNAKVGHIGLYRDPETLNPVEYYCKLPQDIEEREIFVLDPMLATGGIRRGGHLPREAAWRAEGVPGVPHRRARGDRTRPQGAPGGRYLHRGPGQPPERPRLYRPRARRCGGSPVRDQVGGGPP